MCGSLIIVHIVSDWLVKEVKCTAGDDYFVDVRLPQVSQHHNHVWIHDSGQVVL